MQLGETGEASNIQKMANIKTENKIKNEMHLEQQVCKKRQTNVTENIDSDGGTNERCWARSKPSVVSLAPGEVEQPRQNANNGSNNNNNNNNRNDISNKYRITGKMKIIIIIRRRRKRTSKATTGLKALGCLRDAPFVPEHRPFLLEGKKENSEKDEGRKWATRNAQET